VEDEPVANLVDEGQRPGLEDGLHVGLVVGVTNPFSPALTWRQKKLERLFIVSFFELVQHLQERVTAYPWIMTLKGPPLQNAYSDSEILCFL
jgi:hypothetical protein